MDIPRTSSIYLKPVAQLLALTQRQTMYDTLILLSPKGGSAESESVLLDRGICDGSLIVGTPHSQPFLL